MKRLTGLFGVVIALSAMPFTASAADDVGGIAILRADLAGFTEESRVLHDARGVGSLIVKDLGKDGIAEFVIGSGQGAMPTVRSLRADGSEIAAFAVFDETYRGDVRAAAGDLDGDGDSEITAATGPGPSARVRIFDAGITRGEGILAYGAAFKGGLATAIGDWNGDGVETLATVPASGGSAHVRLWDGTGKLVGEFAAFDGTAGDFDAASGDLNGDGKDELVIARLSAGQPVVRVLSPERGTVLHEFVAGPKGVGTSIALGDIDANGTLEILLTGGQPATTYAVDGSGMPKREISHAASAGRMRAAAGSFGKGARLAVAQLTPGDAKNDAAKYVEVDISEQRLRAYEFGKLVKTFLVATGDLSHPTPLGDFSFTEKPYKVNYKWSYGPNNPNNYDLGWVTWNLRFAPHIYVHYAPWRAKFGVRGSHGCVNVSKADAQWIYEWAQVGTPITVRG